MDRGALTGRRLDPQLAAGSAHADVHAQQPAFLLDAVRVEAAAGVDHRELQLGLALQPDLHLLGA